MLGCVCPSVCPSMFVRPTLSVTVGAHNYRTYVWVCDMYRFLGIQGSNKNPQRPVFKIMQKSINMSVNNPA